MSDTPILPSMEDPDGREPASWTWFRVPMALYDRLAEIGRAAAAYLVLAKHCNEAGECWPSQEAVGAALGATDRSVRRHLVTLEKAGLVQRVRRRRDTEVYLLPDLVKTGQPCPLDPLERTGLSALDPLDRTALSSKTGQPCPTKKNQEGESARTRFTPPSVQEVAAYCRERKSGIDPEHFIDYYAARGWKLKGGQGVKDWRAAVRTWERNGFSQSNGKPAVEPEPLKYFG